MAASKRVARRPSWNKQAQRPIAFRSVSGQGGAHLCCKVVAMVQTAKPRHRIHPATWARSSNGLAYFRGLLHQPEVRPVVVVVADVLDHEPPEGAAR
jgi:hypothetical protein